MRRGKLMQAQRIILKLRECEVEPTIKDIGVVDTNQSPVGRVRARSASPVKNRSHSSGLHS